MRIAKPLIQVKNAPVRNSLRAKQEIGHILKVGWFQISIYALRYDLGAPGQLNQQSVSWFPLRS